MTNRFALALAQANPTVGDIAGNLAKARAAIASAAAGGADAILFPELFLIGYPPEDLVLKPALQASAAAALEQLAAETGPAGPAVLMAAPLLRDGRLVNAVALLDEGRIAAITEKHDLPNYGVFDEKRVFMPGPLPEPLEVRGLRLGVPVCEDIWTPKVTAHLADRGAAILAVPNGSPFETGKDATRLALARARTAETGLPLAYLNQVGGQDELVFDGASFVVNADGSLALRLAGWQEAMAVTRWHREGARWICATDRIAPEEDTLAATYAAMMLGLADYVAKNRFPGVVIGLSGGIDSALSAAVAVDALGADKVRCVMMPSRYTSDESLEDAAEVARLIGTHLDTIAIEEGVAAFAAMLAPQFEGRAPDTTEENIQSRIRGVLLMALSNKFGPMVLTTGNKSEMSVGYATLYGDMCGGFNVLKDVYKMQVFALSRWRNVQRPVGARGPDGPVMPQRVIDKPPSAELRPGQKDEDSLPPYPVLDGILEGLVENEWPLETFIARGFDPVTVKRVEHLLNLAEYKRRQAPPGVKITRKSFGRDRRYPITHRFREA